MHVLYLIEAVVFAFFIYGLITQVAMPLWRDTPLFPWFDSEGMLEGKLKDAKQSVLEAELEREINRRRTETLEIRSNVERKESE